MRLLTSLCDHSGLMSMSFTAPGRNARRRYLADRAGQARGKSAGTLFGDGAETPSLLAGLVADANGNRMTQTHGTKKAKRYRYYVSAALLAGDRPQERRTQEGGRQIELAIQA